jgi:hypothetical protein
MMRRIWLALLAATAMQAGTVITITNDIYNYCGGDYCSGGPYSLLATLNVEAGTNLDNLSFDQGPLNTGTGGNLEPYVTSFSFSDGSGFVITNLNATNTFLNIATDGSGNLTAWYFNVTDPQGNFETYWFPTYPQVYYDSNYNGFGADSCFEYGITSLSGTACQGNATTVTTGGAVPEPSTLLLVSVALLALVTLAGRRYLRRDMDHRTGISILQHP